MPVRQVLRRLPASAVAAPPNPTSTELGGPHPVELAGLLHELTVRLLAADGFGQAIERLAAFAVETVPGAAHCSVAVIGEGGPLTIAGHGCATDTFDEIQYATSTGPGLDAARTRAVVTVQDLVADPRWPSVADAARTVGLHSVAAVPIDVHPVAVGALSLYARERDGIAPATLVTAMAVANQAEVLLAELRRRDRLIEGAVLDRAAGVLIAQRNCSVSQAYVFLRDTAQALGLDRRTVADRLIAAVAKGG